MNKKILTVVVTMMVSIGTLAGTGQFEIKKGVNVSGWLSQTTLTGTQRANYFTQQEVRNLAAWGFDHIRLPVAEDLMFVSRTGEKDAATFKLMHNAVEWCREAGMKIIIDFHTLHTNTAATIWTSDATQTKFIEEWKVIADEMEAYPNDLVAFELMNEPVAPLASDWNALAAKVIAAIREKQPERKLIVGSNDWENVNSFKYLTVPTGDPNIILSFHFYIPHPLTHYGAEWTYMNGIETELNYPGELISDDAFNALTTEQQNSLKGYKGYYDRSKLKELVRQAVARAKELGGLQLYCGEFGCYKADRDSKLNWLKDVVSVLNAFDIPYSHWEYKQGFGFCNQSGELIDSEVLSIITTDEVPDNAPEDSAPFFDTFENGMQPWQSQSVGNVTADMVDNPLRCSGNTSDKVLLINKKSVDWPAVQRPLSPVVRIGKGEGRYKYLNMKILNADGISLRIKLYDGNGNEYWMEYVPASCNPQWEDVAVYIGECLQGGNGIAMDGDVAKIAIRPESAGKVYIDNIYLTTTQIGTGIQYINTGKRVTDNKPDIYSCSGGYMGTSISILRPGMYIMNGKKFIKH